MAGYTAGEIGLAFAKAAAAVTAMVLLVRAGVWVALHYDIDLGPIVAVVGTTLALTAVFLPRKPEIGYDGMA